MRGRKGSWPPGGPPDLVRHPKELLERGRRGGGAEGLPTGNPTLDEKRQAPPHTPHQSLAPAVLGATGIRGLTPSPPPPAPSEPAGPGRTQDLASWPPPPPRAELPAPRSDPQLSRAKCTSLSVQREAAEPRGFEQPHRLALTSGSTGGRGGRKRETFTRATSGAPGAITRKRTAEGAREGRKWLHSD